MLSFFLFKGEGNSYYATTGYKVVRGVYTTKHNLHLLTYTVK